MKPVNVILPLEVEVVLQIAQQMAEAFVRRLTDGLQINTAKSLNGKSFLRNSRAFNNTG